MSNDQPPPYEALPEQNKSPHGCSGAYPVSGLHQSQYGQPAYPGGYQEDSLGGGAQPHPPANQLYPTAAQTYLAGPQLYQPATQVYLPAAQPYPPSVQQYPPGAQPFVQYPGAVQHPLPGVTITAAPVMTTTFVNTTVVSGLPLPCGPGPAQVVCPGCHATVLTSTSYQTGLLTWIIFAVLFFLGFWLCCFIPFCVNDCKDVLHQCPRCSTIVGKYMRM